MNTTAQVRALWADWECDTSKYERVALPGEGRVWNLLVADITVPFWEEFVLAMVAHGYLFRESAGGTYNCRNIGGTDKKSLHAFGLALDLNPSVNSFGQDGHDFPQPFIDDVLAIRTRSGEQVFRWGASFSDPMHWEINPSPDHIRTGVADMEYNGVKNVPDADWARRVVDWAVDSGVIVLGDGHVDDWEDDRFSMGRIWTLLYRQST